MRNGGWSSMEAKPEFGGQGLPMVLTTAVNEFWQAANMSFALCHLLTQGQIHALQKSASPDLQQTFIPPMADGRWTGTMNLTEPQAGSDLAAIKSSAVPNGDHYSDHRPENLYHLWRMTWPKILSIWCWPVPPNAPPGIKGISVFIVPKFLPDATGNFTVKTICAASQLKRNLVSRPHQPRSCNLRRPTARLGILLVPKMRASTSCLG